MNAFNSDDENNDSGEESSTDDDRRSAAGTGSNNKMQRDIMNTFQEAYIFHQGSSKEEYMCLYIT